MRARNNVSQIWFASNSLEMKIFLVKTAKSVKYSITAIMCNTMERMIHINQFPLIIPGKDRLIKSSLCKINCACNNLKVTNYQIRTEEIPCKAIKEKQTRKQSNRKIERNMGLCKSSG